MTTIEISTRVEVETRFDFEALLAERGLSLENIRIHENKISLKVHLKLLPLTLCAEWQIKGDLATVDSLKCRAAGVLPAPKFVVDMVLDALEKQLGKGAVRERTDTGLTFAIGSLA